jgi:hypothetical protein
MQQMQPAYTGGRQVDACEPQSDYPDNMSFNNCCLTISDVATPDPFVIYALGKYYMVRRTASILVMSVAD